MSAMKPTGSRAGYEGLIVRDLKKTNYTQEKGSVQQWRKISKRLFGSVPNCEKSRKPIDQRKKMGIRNAGTAINLI